MRGEDLAGAGPTVVSVLALVLSLVNLYLQRRDRKPRLKIRSRYEYRVGVPEAGAPGGSPTPQVNDESQEGLYLRLGDFLREHGVEYPRGSPVVRFAVSNEGERVAYLNAVRLVFREGGPLGRRMVLDPVQQRVLPPHPARCAGGCAGGRGGSCGGWCSAPSGNGCCPCTSPGTPPTWRGLARRTGSPWRSSRVTVSATGSRSPVWQTRWRKKATPATSGSRWRRPTGWATPTSIPSASTPTSGPTTKILTRRRSSIDRRNPGCAGPPADLSCICGRLVETRVRCRGR